MGNVASKKTHYMTFPHTLTGRTREDFEIKIYKNGELFSEIAFDVREVSHGCYTVSFENDGTDFSTWTCIAQDSLEPNIIYVETWEVRKLTVEQNVKQLRSRQDSEGGFFKSSNTDS